MKLKNILKDVFIVGGAVAISYFYLARESGIRVILNNIQNGARNYSAELDSAQVAYGPLFKRSGAGTLHNANIDSTRASQLREKYGDGIGANDIIVAEEQALSRKDIESLIMPVFNEDYFNTLPPRKEFDFKKKLMEKALDASKYTPKGVPYRLPAKELKLIEIPEEVKLIEINENND